MRKLYVRNPTYDHSEQKCDCRLQSRMKRVLGNLLQSMRSAMSCGLLRPIRIRSQWLRYPDRCGTLNNGNSPAPFVRGEVEDLPLRRSAECRGVAGLRPRIQRKIPSHLKLMQQFEDIPLEQFRRLARLSLS